MTIYFDNQSTTRVDPEVIKAMVRMMSEDYANPGSLTHQAGRAVAEQVSQSIASIASLFNAQAEEIIVTSGATESNNLALFGYCLHPRQSRRRVISSVAEHKAILDPLLRLEKLGFEVVRLPVFPNHHPLAGLVDSDQVMELIDDKTALVTLMLANNEVGSIQPLDAISRACQKHGAVLHTDASQAVGRMSTDVQELGVDLLSFSAHKFYGPRGIGGLFVRQSPGSVRIYPQIVGGGQQMNVRSGTLNSVGIVGMEVALRIACELREREMPKQFFLRNRLWQLLSDQIDGLTLNGIMWAAQSHSHRLPNNLNICFPYVDGQSLMLETPELAVSSGSACSSADPEPSHVLRAMGLSEDQARASLRFGIGRFNTIEEIERAADLLANAHSKLARLVNR